jgi:hypothetical protein
MKKPEKASALKSVPSKSGPAKPVKASKANQSGPSTAKAEAAVKPAKVAKTDLAEKSASKKGAIKETTPVAKSSPKTSVGQAPVVAEDHAAPEIEKKSKKLTPAEEKTARAVAPKAKTPRAPSIMAPAGKVSADLSEEGVAGQDDASDEKTEKKKKKDDFKIDRSGDLAAQWKSIFEKSKALKPVPYKMSENYEARTALMHKVLGWGYVLTSQNNRLEVLFQDGIKFLIANYKG